MKTTNDIYIFLFIPYGGDFIVENDRKEFDKFLFLS